MKAHDAVIVLVAWLFALLVVVVVPALVGYMIGGSERTAWATAIAGAVIAQAFALLAGGRR